MTSDSNRSFKFGSGLTSSTTPVKNVIRQVEIRIDQVQPSLFCVYCEWNVPKYQATPPEKPLTNDAIFGDKNANLKNPSQLGNNDGNSGTIKATLSNQTITSSGFGTSFLLSHKNPQKLGITAKSESHLEGKNEQLLPLDSAFCPHCGFSTSSTTKCTRCMRSFEKEKTTLLSLGLESLPGNDLSETLQMSKDPSYGNRRPRVQKSQPTRQTRTKFDEPQCVTLSSDEDDSFQETKKAKCDYSEKFLQQSTASAAIEVQVQANILNDGDSETKVLPGDTEEEKGSIDLLRWKEGGLRGPFFAVNCRSVRIGSYKFIPTERVLFSSEGIMLEAPVFYAHDQPSQNDCLWIDVAIPTQQLLQMEAHFNRQLPVIFLTVTPTLCRRVSSGLRLNKSGPYWDSLSEDESQKRLTLLPCSLDDSAKNAIKQAFVPRGVFREISSSEANKLLLISSPPEVRDALQRLPSGTAVSAETTRASSSSKQDVKALEASDSKNEMRITRGATKSLPRNPLPVVQMFSWSDGPDRFSVTTEDYACLNQDNLLNDSIIDFFVKYVFSTKLDDSLKHRCHVFSSFFYQRLTTHPAKMSGRKHPIEDDSSLSLKEKRHLRVKSWTKKVDIFEKDYLVIPINERNHWFLAIVCFPGLSGPISVKDNKPIIPQFETVAKKTPDGQSKLVTLNGESFHIGNTTITPISSNSKMTESVPVTLSISSERDEAESDDEDILFPQDNNTVEKSMKITEPIKQPCILFFDSLAGSAHNRVATTLREYLMVEYQVKRGTPVENSKASMADNLVDPCNLFSKKTMISACLDVPQQNNSYDCGVFVLQYAEYFMKNPFLDYNIRNIKLSGWFPSYIAGRKRKNIQFLLIRLTKEMNPMADSVLDLLPKEDVKIALQDRQHCRALPALSVTNNRAGEFQKAARLKSDKTGIAFVSSSTHGKNDKKPVEISIDQVRPGLFCVHCQWDKPNDSVAGNKNANFLANPFSGLSIKVPEQDRTQPSPLFGTKSFNGNTKSTATGLVLKPAAFNFTASVPSTLFSFGSPESKAPQQQQTSTLDEEAEAKSSETSLVHTPLGFSTNTSGQPETKNETVKYVAEFTVNQQAYILKASFTTSSCNIVGSLALKEVRTKSWLDTDKVTGDFDEKDDIQLPSAVWANLSGTEKKYHNLTLASLDHSWVSDDFDGSFARFTSFNAGPTNWKALACSVWVQFETSNMREKQALKQITDLYVKQTYCDVQFLLKDDEHIGGHRYILMARSPVFAAMFKNDMEETTTGEVKIEDCEPDNFKQLLHYIYSGRTSTPLTDAIAQSLFVLADKYDIQDLKKECVTFLLSCLRMDNVVGLLVWSHLHSIEELKEVTLTYMARNGKEIYLLKDLEELAKNYPELSVLAFRRMMGCTVH